MRLEIPALSLVALVGTSGSGKTTFAHRHFKPTEVLSSDFFRAIITDDENNEHISKEAFEALYYIAGKRLDQGRLSVVDATNTQRNARQALLECAREHDVMAVAIVLDVPEDVCQQRHANRTDRDFGPDVIKRQAGQLRRSIGALRKEGFRQVYVLSPDDIEHAEIVRTPLWNDKREITGPFDIIGDVHGCYGELCTLLAKLGYIVDAQNHTATPPPGRTAVFVGDLVDRGPDSVGVLRLVMSMMATGQAYCVVGNHEVKLLRHLQGRQVQISHGLDLTIAELDAETQQFRADVAAFIDGLISHYVFDDGRLVVAHAGCKERFQGHSSGRVRAFCLYGETTGETDEYGLPVRLPWAQDYRGRALVVYGHTPTTSVDTINNTVCIDTGCAFGGALTAYRYPERVAVQVPAERQYAAPVKPLGDAAMLAIDDVIGERRVSTRLGRVVKITADNAAAALETMSRYGTDPRWLIYLPPTMSPPEVSDLDDYLEHPAQAFDYYRRHGVNRVVCERKHMGSRAVIIVCRNADTAKARFGVDDGAGIISTRTGRRFFDDATVEAAILDRLRRQLERTGFFYDFNTDWVCLDAELMPWSAKAKDLLVSQYAPVGRAGRSGLASAIDTLRRAGLDALGDQFAEREQAVEAYVAAYRRYCWDVTGVDDYRVAPFHIMATEGRVHTDRDHVWHMETIAAHVCGADPIFVATDYLVVDLASEASLAAGTRWWQELTDAGGEGMVVKPFDFAPAHNGTPVQPAVKCRGREYLRIIYGPEYLLGDHLASLKQRSLAKKRNLALSEFALGLEALERFVAHEPLRRVHECVFGVLALESDPVDPRL